MKIFISGVAGFLGSHLAEQLIEKGHKVIGCDNLIGGYIDNVHCLNQPCMLVELHDIPFCYVTLDVNSDKKIEAINLQHVFPPVGNVKCVELFSFEELPDYRMEEGGADAR